MKVLAWAGLVAVLVWQALEPNSILVRWLAARWHASGTAVEVAVQEQLWRRGQGLDSPAAKLRELERLSREDQARIRKARLAAGFDPRPLVAESRAELALFQRMLSFEPGRYQAALDAGGDTDTSLAQSMYEAVLDQRWLEQAVPALVDDANIAQWYAAHRESLRLPTAYQAAHLFLSGHERGKPDRSQEMQGLAARLAAGADWDLLAAEHSEDERTRHRGGDLGWFTEARMPGDFMQAVKRMRPGQTSGVIRTALGWHLIRLKEIRPARVPELEEVKEEIAVMLHHELRSEQAAALVSKLRAP